MMKGIKFPSLPNNKTGDSTGTVAGDLMIVFTSSIGNNTNASLAGWTLVAGNNIASVKWENNKFVPLRTRWDKTSNPNKHGNFVH